MATIKHILRKEKTRKNGEAPLYIRMTVNRKSKYIAVGQTIAVKYWDNDKQRVKKSHPNASRLNALLAEKKAEVEALALDMERGEKKMGGKGMREALSEGGLDSFIEFGHEFLDRLEKQGRYGTLKSYRTSFKCFTTWLKAKKGVEDISFGKINLDLARDYKCYLEEVLGNHTNTITNKFACLKSMLSYARQTGRVSQNFHPLAGMKLSIKKARKNIPNRDEISMLREVSLHPDSKQAHARNLYLFCCNMAGMRFGDAVTLRWGQIESDRLRWQTGKTFKQRVLYIPQEAQDILSLYRGKENKPDDFVFPFLQGHEFASKKYLHGKSRTINVSCNAFLKRVCKKAGLSAQYTFHTSRHFFATDFLRNGGRVEVLQHLLTHSSLNQTMEYAQIVNEDMDAALLAYEQSKTA